MSDDTAIAAAATIVAGAAEQLAEEAGDSGLSPQEAELERTIVVEEEATKRELARLETELKIAKLQAEKPPWLEELVALLTAQHQALLSLLTQTTLTQPPPQPQAVAIAAPQETEASGAGAIAETHEESDESGEATPVQPEAEVAAEEVPRKRTFSRGI